MLFSSPNGAQGWMLLSQGWFPLKGTDTAHGTGDDSELLCQAGELLLGSWPGFAPSLQEVKKLFFAPCSATVPARKSKSNNNNKKGVEGY